jgi:MFS family permease
MHKLATVMVLVYITEGPTIGWLALNNLVLLITGLILYGVFIAYEERVEEPLLRLDLFKIRNFAVSNIVGLVSGVGMFMVFIFFVYYAQLPSPSGLGLSIIESGLLMSPVAFGMVIFGPIFGRLMPKIGPKPVLIAGSLISALSYFFLLINRSTPIDLVEDGLLSSVGLVAVILPLVNMVALSLPDEYRTTGMGMNTMLRTLGGAAGPVAATVLMDSYENPVIMMYNNQPLVLGYLPSSTAFDYIAILGILIMFITLIVSLWTKNYTFKANRAAAPA